MYTRDTAFSTWPTNCTGQQRGAQLSAFGWAWLQETSMHKSLQRLLLLQKIIFGKKTSFLEIIDYYTILYAPSNIPPPWSIIQSSPATGCCYWDRILLQKEAGLHNLMLLIDDWPACNASIAGEEEQTEEGEHFQIIRCCGVRLTASLSSITEIMTMIILYEKCIGHLRLLIIIIIIECGLRKGDRKETPKSI